MRKMSHPGLVLGHEVRPMHLSANAFLFSLTSWSEKQWWRSLADLCPACGKNEQACLGAAGGGGRRPTEQTTSLENQKTWGWDSS